MMKKDGKIMRFILLVSKQELLLDFSVLKNKTQNDRTANLGTIFQAWAIRNFSVHSHFHESVRGPMPENTLSTTDPCRNASKRD